MSKIVLFFENLNKRERILAILCFMLLGFFTSYKIYDIFIKEYFYENEKNLNIFDFDNKNKNLKQEIKNLTKQINEKEEIIKTKNISFVKDCKELIKNVLKEQKFDFYKKSNNINISFETDFKNILYLIRNLEQTKQALFIKQINISNMQNSILLKTDIKLFCIQKEKNE